MITTVKTDSVQKVVFQAIIFGIESDVIDSTHVDLIGSEQKAAFVAAKSGAEIVAFLDQMPRTNDTYGNYSRGRQPK